MFKFFSKAGSTLVKTYVVRLIRGKFISAVEITCVCERVRRITAHSNFRRFPHTHDLSATGFFAPLQHFEVDVFFVLCFTCYYSHYKLILPDGMLNLNA